MEADIFAMLAVWKLNGYNMKLAKYGIEIII
jgi:hypothetical protein